MSKLLESPMMRTKIKNEKVTLFPEAGLGYLLGPLLAIVNNGVVNMWLIQYWDKVLMLSKWAPVFESLLPIFSAVVIIMGNLLVGRLMERKPTVVGKARPLILLGMPVIAVALLALFIVPLPVGAGGTTNNVIASIVIAFAYNLYYAFAWPLYYTAHSGLVNLSTREEKSRGLLSTCIMAAQLGAVGVAGMAGGVLVDLIGLLPKYSYTLNGEVYTTNILDEAVAKVGAANVSTLITVEQANSKWTILMIILIAALVVGCLLEYFFTRERVTEEKVLANSNEETQIKAVSMKEQISVCMKDRYWWLIMVFFFLYQFGGQMKNCDLSFYSQAMTGGNTLLSIINTVGAIPTALGMAIVWPLANKFSKSKAIIMGAILAFVGGLVSFIPLLPSLSGNIGAITGLSVASFCIKALGSTPAMYISLALLANVLDHQEARTGIRTDGFSMAVYGSIMVAMAGVCNGIIVGINNIIPVESLGLVHTILGFGVEATCYLVMAIIFIWMNVEKYSEEDKKILAENKAQ